METITQGKTDIDMCPVQAWAATVTRIQSYAGTSGDTPIDAFSARGKIFSISSAVMRAYLRRATTEIGTDKLGFETKSVGTHSIRSSFAMMLLLNNEAESVVMKKGRWKSNAFL